jgi:hypothetical protein
MTDATRSRFADSSVDARAVHGAGALHIALGVGFGIGALVAISHYARHGELPMTPWGFRALGGGPFEQLGPVPFTALGWSLVLVSALDVLAGIWLLQGRRRGLRLGLATAAPAFGLSVGFALPFLLVGVPIRLALVVAGRRHLR